MTLRTLNYGNYGIFLIMGNAGFCPSAVASRGVIMIIALLPPEAQVLKPGFLRADLPVPRISYSQAPILRYPLVELGVCYNKIVVVIK